jgi:hypothetical protein
MCRRGSAESARTLPTVADQHPYRSVTTGVVQLLTEDQAGVFPGAFDRLADDYERLDAEARQAAADAENAESGHKREAQAAAKAAAEAAANVVVESAADTETKES